MPRKKKFTDPGPAVVDKVFESLIRGYTRTKQWDLLEDTFYHWGVILESRDARPS